LRAYSTLGQVVGLTVVGISEYLVIWFGTDWELEVEKGAKRNEAEGDPTPIVHD
jgi:multidrug resistance protein, MATE family